MGGRGARSGVNVKNGAPYGTEYKTVLKSGNIKFVVVVEGSNDAPMETMTRGRVYVTVDKNTNELKYITYYDKNNMRAKQIDLQHPHDNIIPHTHHGYFHNENDSPKGAAKLTDDEKKMVDITKKLWYNHINGKA